ncbi:MAG: hypothetical protein ACI4OR_03345 [Alphaproteobacteria bacterium]
MTLKDTLKNGMRTIKYDDLYIALGGTAIRDRGQATTTNTLGTVIVNAAEGMMIQNIKLPLGVASVNKVYILNELKNNNDARLIEDHKPDDNQLMVGPKATPYLVAPGIVLVEHNEFGLKFDGKPMPSKEFSIPRNPNIHITEDEEFIMENSSSVRGRELGS